MRSKRAAPCFLALLLLVLYAGMVQFTLPLTANPVYAQAKAGWFDRAQALEKAHDWPALLAHCQQWTRAEAGNFGAWWCLGSAYRELGRNQEAIDAYQKALSLRPDFEVAWYDQGVIYIKLQRYPEAIKALREALRLKPDYANAWFNLGHAYGKLDRYEEEIGAYREVLRLKPDDTSAWYSLAAAYANSGNRSAALEAVKELRRYDPQKADKIFNLIMKP